MKTGRYRIRRGHLGCSVLQYEYEIESPLSGKPIKYWADVPFEHTLDVAEIVLICREQEAA